MPIYDNYSRVKLDKDNIQICYGNDQIIYQLKQNYIQMDIIKQIQSPTLLLDEKKCRSNLKNMIKKANKWQKQLCPHWKTSQSRMVASWAQQQGIEQITVSSLIMAEYMAAQLKWKNIHIAFPCNVLQIERINNLSAKISLSIQIVNIQSIKMLSEKLQHQLGFMIQIDSNQLGIGIKQDDLETIQKIIEYGQKSEYLKFKGFYMHPGTTYDVSSKEQRKKLYAESFQKLQKLKNMFNTKVRIGDTPGICVLDDMGPVQQLSPGNFVFFDYMQYNFGSCRKQDIAVCLAVPVITINKKDRLILVHGGGVHLSKDFMIQDGKRNYGEVVLFNNQGWQAIEGQKLGYLKKIKQEHGIIQASQELLNNVKIGSIIGILPIHSCMTADCMKSYKTLDGKQVDHGRKFYSE